MPVSLEHQTAVMLQRIERDFDAVSDSPLTAACQIAQKDVVAGRMVLCIEDSRDDASKWRGVLEEAGYSVLGTDSPATGLSLYLLGGFDAVILDFHLPLVSGGLLASVMHRFRQDIPLIVVSDTDSAVAHEPGVPDCQLARQTAPGLLLDRLHEVIERARRVPQERKARPQKAIDSRAALLKCAGSGEGNWPL